MPYPNVRLPALVSSHQNLLIHSCGSQSPLCIQMKKIPCYFTYKNVSVSVMCSSLKIQKHLLSSQKIKVSRFCQSFLISLQVVMLLQLEQLPVDYKEQQIIHFRQYLLLSKSLFPAVSWTIIVLCTLIKYNSKYSVVQ